MLKHIYTVYCINIVYVTNRLRLHSSSTSMESLPDIAKIIQIPAKQKNSFKTSRQLHQNKNRK